MYVERQAQTGLNVCSKPGLKSRLSSIIAVKCRSKSTATITTTTELYVWYQQQYQYINITFSLVL